MCKKRENDNALEKREHERIPDVNLPLTIELYTRNHPVSGKYTGIVEDISLGGLLASLPHRLKHEPNRLFISFSFPTGENFEYVRARIARTCQMEDRYTYGMAFFAMASEKKAKLKSAIANLNRPG